MAYAGHRTDGEALLRKLADGSGEEEELVKVERHSHAASWSPDGKVLAFEMEPIFSRDIWFLPLEGDRKPTAFSITPFDEVASKFSPDGRWIAYMSDESGRREVYVQPYPGPGGKRQISARVGKNRSGARDGRELFFRNGDRMMVVEVATEPTFSAGTPRVLSEGDYLGAGIQGLAQYDVSPDGQRFVMIQPIEGEGGLSQIQVVLNWFEELKERVPAGQ